MKLRTKISLILSAIIIASLIGLLFNWKDINSRTFVVGEFEFDCPTNWNYLSSPDPNDTEGCDIHVKPAGVDGDQPYQPSEGAQFAAYIETIDKSFKEYVQKDNIELFNKGDELLVESEPYEWKGISGWRLISTHPYGDTDMRLIPIGGGKAVLVALLRYQGHDDAEKAEYHAMAEKVFETLHQK